MVAGGCVRYGLRRRGANQAVAAARIGGAVAFIGAVGDDEGGRLARSELEAAESMSLATAISSRPTPRAMDVS